MNFPLFTASSPVTMPMAKPSARATASRLPWSKSATAHNDTRCVHDEVSQLAEQVQSIEAAARSITEIVAVIDGIAFQTNLRALNAAVEAARAGEHGRGFGVVVTEMPALAQRAAHAADQIRSLSAQTATRIQHGSASVTDANGAVNGSGQNGTGRGENRGGHGRARNTTGRDTPRGRPRCSSRNPIFPPSYVFRSPS